jgi:anti-sigma factor ChrR (cupin superfamily)
MAVTPNYALERSVKDLARRMTRHRFRLILALVGAVTTAALSADEPPDTTRAEYDEFMAAFVLEQYRASCERHAPEVYAKHRAQADTWRVETATTIRRLESAARRWELPGGRSVDDLLAHIATSTDDEYASMTDETREARCKAFLLR